MEKITVDEYPDLGKLQLRAERPGASAQGLKSGRKQGIEHCLVVEFARGHYAKASTALELEDKSRVCHQNF